MKFIYKILSIICFVGLIGCGETFEEINQDPNNPTSVPTSFILTSAQRDLVREFLGVDTDAPHANWAMQYMQYWSSTLYTETSRYQDIKDDWAEVYFDGLNDLEEIIRINTDEELKSDAAQYGSNNNQIAIAKILQVWGFHNVSDIWGDIPFSQALKGSDIFSPAYDSQEDVYHGLIDMLDEAATLIGEGGSGPEGDLIFSGDMEKWRLFANSLKLRIGMRLSKVDQATAEMWVSEAVSDGVISNMDDNVYFPYLLSSPNYNPWYFEVYVDGGTFTLACTNTFIDALVTYNDPRLPKFAAPSQQDGVFLGIPYGVESAVASQYDNREVSFQSQEVYDSPGRIMTYSEVLLLQAEAAERGWISGDPETLYEAGILANMEEWGLNLADVDTDAYLNQASVSYDPSNFEELIGNQLWFALYLQPLESWAQWRRLGYPDLQPAPAAIQNRDIPRRRGYPADEATLNRVNYEAAVAVQGPDLLETRIWWDAE